MTNYASSDQLNLVGLNCPKFSAKTCKISTKSCEACRHWNGTTCQIKMFDPVLTSLDQT
ncbi:conserved hypothetical protein [Carboxydothermus islandicus]|uniref:Uncharacterized protein n=1 Tax=Carboxydothermus islandicus TaxID=661089 RepID=A0A1L8D029_9THEO|nr:hypothetical protein [Carboxydothermus islandicus]GAV24493.1 conserved hypothetical protein [Carboxydothermus islandicus]